MKVKLEYSGKTIFLEPYNTNLEKDILLYETVVEDDVNIDGIMDILKNNISGDIDNLSHNEKLAILFKLRSLSIGEEIPIKFVCEKCKRADEQALNISEIIIPGKGDYKIHDVFEEVTEDNLQKFVDIDVDELDFDEFDELMKQVKDSTTAFSLKKEAKCASCGHKQLFDISDESYVISSMSEDTIMSIYQTIADLIFYGKYTKLDIDSMLPFERTIFVGILNKTREELGE